MLLKLSLLLPQEIVLKIEFVEDYDHVIVASGHFSMPNVPFYDGFEHFSGRSACSRFPKV